MRKKKAVFFLLVATSQVLSLAAQPYGFSTHGSALVLGDIGATGTTVGFSGDLGPAELKIAPRAIVNTASDPAYSPGLMRLSLRVGPISVIGGRYAPRNFAGRFVNLGSERRENESIGNALGVPDLTDSGDWRGEIVTRWRGWTFSASGSALYSRGSYADSPPYGSLFFRNSLALGELVDPFDNVLTRGEVLWESPVTGTDALVPGLSLAAETPLLSLFGTRPGFSDQGGSRIALWGYNGAALDGPVISRLTLPLSGSVFRQYFAPVYGRVTEGGFIYAMESLRHGVRAGAVYTRDLPVASGTVSDVTWGDWQAWALTDRLELYASAEFEIWRLRLGGEWKHSQYFNPPEAIQYPWLDSSVACWVSGNDSPAFGLPVPEISILRSLRDGSMAYRLGFSVARPGNRSLSLTALYIAGSTDSELGQFGANRWGASLAASW